MQTRSLDFKLRANAPGGQKRFSLRAFPLRTISVFRHSLRWLTLLPVVLLPLVARAADVVTRHDGTPSGNSTLQVESGTGDGSYAAGTVVRVTADPAPAGQHFVGWTGDTDILSDAGMATTTALIPSMDVTIAAKYQLNVHIGFPIDEN